MILDVVWIWIGHIIRPAYTMHRTEDTKKGSQIKFAGHHLVPSRLLITATIGVLATILVYFGLEESLNRPSVSNIPVPPDVVLKIVAKQFNISAQDSKNLKFNNVYVNPSGEVYQSDSEFRTIGSLLGKTEATETGGSHYAWEISDLANRKSFYIDHVTGQVISVNNETIVSQGHS
jgi:hypothetical protein